jgi:hypothetical protein
VIGWTGCTCCKDNLQSCIPREERESLLSTGRRLNWCDRTDAQGGVDSPRSLGFRVAVRRMSSGSSSVQVSRMAQVQRELLLRIV